MPRARTSSSEHTPPFFKARGLNVPSETERKVLSAVLRQEGITQPAISRETNTPQQSVSRHVKALLERGALLPVERTSRGRRGQPGVAVKIAPKFAYSFGVSMMTDAMSVAFVDFAGEVLHQQHFTLPAMTRTAVINTLETSFSDILKSSRVPRNKVLGVGVGISGYCIDGKSRYNTPRLLDNWALVEIDDILSTELGLPVWVENDGNAAAIGEALYGHGRYFASLVYVYVAAGIGGGVILDRELWRGTHGNGGELGLSLPTHLLPLPTLDLLKQMIAQEGVELSGISEMLDRYDNDWPGVDAWVARTSEAFSYISSSIAALLDVEAIVLGGRLPTQLAKKIIPQIEIYDDARRAEPRPMPRILVSDVEGDASAIGAAALPFKKYFFAGK